MGWNHKYIISNTVKIFLTKWNGSRKNVDKENNKYATKFTTGKKLKNIYEIINNGKGQAKRIYNKC